MTLLVDRFRGMGTDCAVQTTDPACLAPIRSLCLAVEAVASRFIPDSELSRLNRAGGGAVSPLLAELLTTALQAHAASDGLVDPTILKAVRDVGYVESWPRVGPASSPASPWYPGGLAFDPVSRHVSLAAGCGLDLGGIAKGWAADAAIACTEDPILVDLGGDISVRRTPPGQDAWYIAIDDPWQPGRDVAVVALRGGGIATSSTLQRRLATPQGRAHHLIDPRTGRPAASDCVAATVVAASAVQAEMFAKVAVIAGAEAAVPRLVAAGAAAWLFLTDGSVRRCGQAEVVVDAAQCNASDVVDRRPPGVTGAPASVVSLEPRGTLVPGSTGAPHPARRGIEGIARETT